MQEEGMWNEGQEYESPGSLQMSLAGGDRYPYK